MKAKALYVLLLAVIGGSSVFAQSVTPVFPGTTWATKTPAEVGLSSSALTTFSNYMGGRGTVVRYGYQVYTWGDPNARGDVASACKPFYSHFLFKALEDGRIPSMDQTVVTWEPALNNINAALGYKDRNITWRHMANQISCYGVSENPGTAYCYNDWQMALFFDTLFTKVYGATYSNVDANVLRPMLTNILQCQDNPTFMAFGTGDRPGRVGVSPRDFARLGLLYLNEGNWNGTRLLSAAHAKEAVRSSLSNVIRQSAGVAAEMIPGQRSIGSTTVPDNQTDHMGSYSWLWWTNGADRTGARKWPNAPMDTFGAMGHGGRRCCVVIPSLDMVISWNDCSSIDTDAEQAEALRLLMLAVNGGAKPMIEQTVVDASHPQWFARERTSPYFLCGPGDPEGFLYRGTRNADGTRNGDQMSLISKLKGTGANSIYMQIVRSHGGDGGSTENPFINSDPTQPLDQDILNQWEDWFAEMDRNNITIFLFLYDDSARIWNTGDTVGSTELSFIQGIVNRFEHHRNLIWCVAEEYAEVYTANRVANIAAQIRAADMHKHPIAVHKNTGLDFTEFANNVNIDQFAIQYNVPTAGELHTGMVSAWNTAAGRYNLNMSENAEHGIGATARRNNWAIAMGGAYVMILGMDIAGTAVSDLQDCGRLVSFFESTKFNEMSPRDDLIYGGTQYLLANPGSSYIAYASNLVGNIGIRGMTAGTYRFKWMDCATGTVVIQDDVAVAAGDRTWAKPAGIGNELAVYIGPPDSSDVTPPGPVTGFAAAGASGQISLSWTNPSDSDFTGTTVRFRTDTYPISATDGALVTEDSGSPGAAENYTHAGLTNGTTYYYAAFAHDGSYNYSASATASAAPNGQAAWNSLGTQQSLGSGTTPGIATDSAGNIHVVYMNGGGIYYRLGNSSGVFGSPEPIPVPEGSGDYNSPHVVVDSNNIPHVAFEKDWISSSKKAWYTNRIGGSWKTPVVALAPDPASNRVNYPRLAVYGSNAYVGAFLAGTVNGQIAKLSNLSTTPTVDRTVSTSLWVPTPVITTDGRMFVVGRNGASGHYVQEYSLNLDTVGTWRKISTGTPEKTGEATAAILDPDDIVHAAGVTASTGFVYDMIWYNSTQRLDAGQNSVLGLADGAGLWNENVYPTLACDSTGRIYVSYRDFTTGEGKAAIVSSGAFTTPVAYASSVTNRLRWNPHIAPTPTGGVYVVWDSGGTVYFRSIGAGSGVVGGKTLQTKAAGTITIDGSAGDWNLPDFTTKIRGGQSGTGDIALVGFDGGTPYYGAYSGVLPTSAADHTAQVYSRHDASYLYFLVRCDDDDIRYSSPTSTNWQNDCVEFYIDPSHDGGAVAMSNSTSDVQLVIDANNQKNVYMATTAYAAQVLAGVTSAVVRDGTGWWLEARILKSALDPDLPNGGTIGLDFNFRDNDNNNDPTLTTVYTWNETSTAGFPSKIPDHWGDASLNDEGICFLESFPYSDGNLNGNIGWTGTSGAEILVTGQTLKIIGGSTNTETVRTISSCSGSGGIISARMLIKAGLGTTTLWSLWINDAAGNNLARWYGSGTTARGRIGGTGDVTASQNLTGTSTWDGLEARINTTANTSEFFFNGVSIGALSHASQGAGDTVGQVKFERIYNSLSIQNVYLDDLAVGNVDTTAPSAPASFAATATSGQNALTWTNPAALDFAETRILFKTTGYPTGRTDGTVIYSGTGINYTHTGLADGTRYYYAAYARDAAWNFSSAATATALYAPPPATILEAKGLANGEPRTLTDKVVTAAFSGYFYIQEPDSYHGIRVISTQYVEPGWEVDVVGVTGGAGAERFIDATASAIGTTAPGPGRPAPLGMGNRDVGGSLLNALAPGIVGGIGPNNIGTLVTVWGKVTQRQPTAPDKYFYISDGSPLADGTETDSENNIGIRIAADPALYPDDYVLITGIVSCFDSGGLRPVILLAQ